MIDRLINATNPTDFKTLSGLSSRNEFKNDENIKHKCTAVHLYEKLNVVIIIIDKFSHFLIGTFSNYLIIKLTHSLISKTPLYK